MCWEPLSVCLYSFIFLVANLYIIYLLSMGIPKTKVLYHIRIYFRGISPYIAPT